MGYAMLNITLWAMGLGSLLALLGFVALLTSKFYVAGKSQVEVQVPFLGKMKGNYPALVLVFLGVGLAVYALKTNADEQKIQQKIESDFVAKKADYEKKIALLEAKSPGQADWIIKGQFLPPPGKQVSWDHGILTYFPESTTISIDRAGRYEMRLKIPRGTDFEHYVQRFNYSHDLGSIDIVPEQELAALEQQKPSALVSKTDTTRVYKPIPIVAF